MALQDLCVPIFKNQPLMEITHKQIMIIHVNFEETYLTSTCLVFSKSMLDKFSPILHPDEIICLYFPPTFSFISLRKENNVSVKMVLFLAFTEQGLFVLTD